MKGAGKRILTIILLSLLFCSLSFPAYAASDFYDPDLYQYKDSFLDDSNTENKSLVFFPLIPSSKYANYILIYSPSQDYYYLFLFTKVLFNHAEFYGGRLLETPFDLYKYNHHISNDWELVQSNVGLYDSYYRYHFSDYIIIDATINCVKTSIAAGGWVEINYTANTGYRVYWFLSIIVKHVLLLLSNLATYVLERPFLRMCFLIFFVGEVFMFVVILIHKIGALRCEGAS